MFIVVVLVLALLVALLVLLMSITSIGPTEIGLVTKRFGSRS